MLDRLLRKNAMRGHPPMIEGIASYGCLGKEFVFLLDCLVSARLLFFGLFKIEALDAQSKG
jgi:hypothetical protein